MDDDLDDLASALRGSHIAQDEIDLKALQAQLAQTLYGGQIPMRRRRQNTVSNSFSDPRCTPVSSPPTTSSMAGCSNFSTATHLDAASVGYMPIDDFMDEPLLLPPAPNPEPLIPYSRHVLSRTSPPSDIPMSSSPFRPSSPPRPQQLSTSFANLDPFYLSLVNEQHQSTFMPNHASFVQYDHHSDQSTSSGRGADPALSASPSSSYQHHTASAF